MTPKLSPAQQRVMLWLSQGWGARVSHGNAVEINGQRVCNVDTMTVLSRMGLVERESRPPYWMATAAGRRLSPMARGDESNPENSPATAQQPDPCHHLCEKPRGLARGRERGPRSGPRWRG